MGLFSSVIHVRDANADLVRKALTDVVPGWNFDFAEERAPRGAPQDAPADTLLYLVSPRRGHWCSILEGHCFLEGAPGLSDLAKSLSAALATYTLALMVHDDDVLYYNLCRAGDDLDGYNSNPQYFETARLSDDAVAEQRHDPRPFAPLLPDGVTVAELQTILDCGWWSAYAGGRLDTDGVPQDEPGFVFEGERMVAIGNLLRLHGNGEGYPFADWADNASIEWPSYRELRFQRG